MSPFQHRDLKPLSVATSHYANNILNQLQAQAGNSLQHAYMGKLIVTIIASSFRFCLSLAATYVWYSQRHGQTEYNRQGIVQGQFDAALDDEGRYQAKVTGRFLQNTSFDAAYSSDLSRAYDTAKSILDSNLTPIKITKDKRLRERALGSLENKPRPKDLWNSLPDDVETSQALRLRVCQFWDDLVLSFQELDLTTDKRVLVVSHGAALMTLFLCLQADGYQTPKHEKTTLANCCITQISLIRQQGEWHGTIDFVNNTDHFTQEHITTAVADSIDKDTQR